MKIHYAHQNPPKNSGYKRGTFAIVLPTKEVLENCLKEHATCTLINSGWATVHPKEHFVKKIGRETAILRLEFNLSHFLNIEIRNTSLIYNMKITTASKSPNKKVEEIFIGLATTAETNHVKLLYMYVN